MALQMHTEILQIQERVLGPSSPQLHAGLHNVAMNCARLGLAQGAVDILRPLLEKQRREPTLGNLHPETLSTRNSLANRLAELGQLREAAEMSFAVLNDRTAVLGPDHPETLSSMHIVVLRHAELGHVAERVRLASDLVEHYTRILGPSHPATLNSMSSLATRLSEAGDFASAVELYRKFRFFKVLAAQHKERNFPS